MAKRLKNFIKNSYVLNKNDFPSLYDYDVFNKLYLND